MSSESNSEKKIIRIGQRSIELNPDLANAVDGIVRRNISATKRSIDKFAVPSRNSEDAKKSIKKVSRSAIPSGLKNSSSNLSSQHGQSPSAGVNDLDAGKIIRERKQEKSQSKSGNRRSVPKSSPKAPNTASSIIGGMNPTLLSGAGNLLGSRSSQKPSIGEDASQKSTDSNAGKAISDSLSGLGNKTLIGNALNANNTAKNATGAINSNIADKLSGLNALGSIGDGLSETLITKRVSRPGPIPNLLPVISKEDAEKRTEQAKEASGALQKMALGGAADQNAASNAANAHQNTTINALAMAASDDQKRKQMQGASGGAVDPKGGKVFDRAMGGNNQNRSEQGKGTPPPVEDDSEDEVTTTVKGKVAIAAGAGVLAIVAAISSVGVGVGGGAAGTNAIINSVNNVDQNRCEPISTNPEVDADGGSPDMQNAQLNQMKGVFNGEIKENAYLIVEGTWEYDKVPSDKKARAAVIAIATATQESTLRNVGYGDNAGPDSRGLFQQRNPWGTLEERMNPKKATQLFLARLMNIPNWDTIPLTEAAQRVQISAHPDLYAKWEEWAKWVLQQYRSEQGGGGTTEASGQLSLTHPASTAGLFNLGFVEPNVSTANSQYGDFGDNTWKPPSNDTIWNQNITNDIRAVYLKTRTSWPSISSYGGWSQRAKGGDHPLGKALDIMIPDYKSAKSISTGNEIADYFVANHQRYGITYVIWRNKMWLPSTGKWQVYNGANMYSGNELNDTTLHMDHVHVSVEGSGGEYTLPENNSNSNTIDNGNTPDQVECGDDPLLEGETINNEDGIPQGLVKDNWSSPMPGAVLKSKYGPRACPPRVTCNKWVRFHYGLDIADGVGRGTGVGSPVYAPTKMKITLIRYKDEIGYGTSLLARSIDDPKYVFDFHHFAEGTIMVKVGDVVEAGTPIARAGTTGNSNGVHLHFQMMKPSSVDTKMIHNDTIDPRPILDALGLAPKAG